MDADWYVDPVGRFHGRYFDGARWTDQVSDDGTLAVDPDWPPVPIGDDEDAVRPDVLSVEGETFELVSTPAVARLIGTGPRRASMLEESPTRVVAVLEDFAPRPQVAPVSPRRRRRVVVMALVALCAALLGLVIWLIARGGESGDPTLADSLDPNDSMQVGSSMILNGASTLGDLSEWHRDFARERGVVLDDSSSCWFGELAGTIVSSVHCGPVGGPDAADLLFDSVPLRFEDVNSGQIVGQIVNPVFDEVTTDVVIAFGLDLVGTPDQPAPPDRQKARGDRATGD
jgi:hypothetical protein